MQPAQIRPITKTVQIRFAGVRVSLPVALRLKIDRHWAALTKDNPHLRNGEVFTVTNVAERTDKIEIDLAETDYAHYLYSHQVDTPDQYVVRIIHSAALVITSDNMYILGAMGKHTSRPGVIQCCGGGIDHEDITNGVVDIKQNTARELREELGIVHAESFEPTYLKSGGPTGKMTLVYTVRLRQSSADFLRTYKGFVKRLRHNNEDPEFDRLYVVPAEKRSVERFIKKNEAMLNEYVPILLRQSARA